MFRMLAEIVRANVDVQNIIYRAKKLYKRWQAWVCGCRTLERMSALVVIIVGIIVGTKSRRVILDGNRNHCRFPFFLSVRITHQRPRRAAHLFESKVATDFGPFAIVI